MSLLMPSPQDNQQNTFVTIAYIVSLAKRLSTDATVVTTKESWKVSATMLCYQRFLIHASSSMLTLLTTTIRRKIRMSTTQSKTQLRDSGPLMPEAYHLRLDPQMCLAAGMLLHLPICA